MASVTTGDDAVIEDSTAWAHDNAGSPVRPLDLTLGLLSHRDGFGDTDKRPSTASNMAAAVVNEPTSGTRSTRSDGRTKRSDTTKSTAPRPPSAGIRGWDDFDADRLLVRVPTDVNLPRDDAHNDNNEAKVQRRTAGRERRMSGASRTKADDDTGGDYDRKQRDSINTTPARERTQLPLSVASPRLFESQRSPLMYSHQLQNQYQYQQQLQHYVPPYQSQLLLSQSLALEQAQLRFKSGRAMNAGGNITALDFEPPFDSRMLLVRRNQLRAPLMRQPPTGGGPSTSLPGFSLSPSKHKQSRLPRIDPAPAAMPLFGFNIEDTQEARETIFGRFRLLWSLMATRPATAVATSAKAGKSAKATTTMREQPKSPFECSLVLIKVCKACGISLGAASNENMPFYQVKERDIAFDMFCHLVVRNSVQPTLHHFKRDRSVDDFVHAVDMIVESLLTRASPELIDPTAFPPTDVLRLKELNEVMPVFPHWKRGITVASSAPRPSSRKAGRNEEDGDRAVRASLPEREDGQRRDETPASSTTISLKHLLHPESIVQLPFDEARSLQDANMRQRVRLRHSWQPRKEEHAATVQASAGSPQKPSAVPETDATRPEDLLSAAVSIHSIAILQHEDNDKKHNKPESSAGDSNNACIDNDTNGVAVSPASPPKGGIANEEVLVCSACMHHQAELWCSSCFAVYCPMCWTAAHNSVVDMSCVHAPHSSLMVPAIGQLQQQDDEVRPPVSIVYLPTKPVGGGKLIKSTQRRNSARNSARSDTSQNTALASGRETFSVVAQPYLPQLIPRAKAEAHHSQFHRAHGDRQLSPSTKDSAADLLKALLLKTGTMATDSSPSAASPESWSSASPTMRAAKEAAKRQNLHTSAVLLDGNDLVGFHSPARRQAH
ncbi:TPA: hypothetical protein N0F65_006871 [Lagenidium giganteum]|uniref:B box-type domain-containing protein n=1 Tax=Lagenidium giganteum TaxID=4803 RepID=A0AAV2ZH10_9STRA|nr:TPA: hypothetical protein N0F65_006871 [Lagenidium giganteum]